MMLTLWVSGRLNFHWNVPSFLCKRLYNFYLVYGKKDFLYFYVIYKKNMQEICSRYILVLKELHGVKITKEMGEWVCVRRKQEPQKRTYDESKNSYAYVSRRWPRRWLQLGIVWWKQKSYTNNPKMHNIIENRTIW